MCLSSCEGGLALKRIGGSKTNESLYTLSPGDTTSRNGKRKIWKHLVGIEKDIIRCLEREELEKVEVVLCHKYRKLSSATLHDPKTSLVGYSPRTKSCLGVLRRINESKNNREPRGLSGSSPALGSVKLLPSPS